MFRTIDQFFNNRNLTGSEKKFIKNDDSIKIHTDPKEIIINNNYINPEILIDEGENSYCNDYDSDCETGIKNPRNKSKKYNNNNNYKKKYVVSLIGRNKNGDSFCCHVIGYKLFLYILIPTFYEKNSKEYMNGSYEIDNEKESEIKGVKYFTDKLVFGLKNQIKIVKKHKSKIIDHEIIFKKNYYGFRNNEKNFFIKLSFDNSNTKRKYYWACIDKNIYIPGVVNKPLKIFEFKVLNDVRFYHDGKNGEILPQSWINVKKYINIPNYEKLTNCDYEISVKYEDVISLKDKKDHVPTVKLSWDIETAPKKRRKGHPNLKKKDPIIQIGCSFLISKGSKLIGIDNKEKSLSNFEGTYNIILTLNKSYKSKKENFKIVECYSEVNLLNKFIELLRKGPAIYFKDKLIINGNYKKWIPNYMLTYNGNNFDWNYVYEKCLHFGITDEIDRTSCFFNFKCLYYKRETTSAGMGKVNNSYLVHPGIINIDLLKIVEKMQITDMLDIKLKTACDYFLLSKKSGHNKVIKYYKEKLSKYSENIYEIDDKTNNLIFKKDYIIFLKDVFEDFHKKEENKESLEAKIDLSYEQMYVYYFDSIENPNTEDSKIKMKTISDYCIRDCEVLHRLNDKLSIIYNYEARANISSFPMKNVLLKGVDIVNFSLVSKFTQKYGFLYPNVSYDEEKFESTFYNELKIDKEYKKFYDKLSTNDKKIKEKKKFLDRERIKGAIVFSPKSGNYKMISTLDVKSEYPSTMMTYNLSHEKIVLNNKKYGNIKGVKYFEKEWKGKDYHNYKEKKKDPWRNKIYKSKIVIDINNRTDEDEGVIVKVLRFLLNRRNAIKNSMKTMKENSTEYMIANSEQLATKVYMNAIYGSLSYSKSPLYLKALGGITTQLARDYLTKCKDLVEDKFEGSEIIYGDTDSIFVKWKIPEKYVTSEEKFYYIWDLSIKAEKYINKTIHDSGLKYLTIELEKVFSKLKLFDIKKRYFGILHKKRDFNKGKLKIMGIKSKKRDSTKIEKFVEELVIYYTIDEKMDLIIPFIRSLMKQCYEGLFDYKYFLKSARYKPPYTFPDRISHAVAVKIIKEHDSGIQIDSNERVFYLYKRIKYGKGKMGGKKITKKTSCVWPEMLYNEKITIDYKIYFDYIIKNSEDFLCLLLKIKSADLTKEQKTRIVKKTFTNKEVNAYEDVFAENGSHITLYTIDDLEDEMFKDDEEDIYMSM
jgi:DNA polymerase elongation subunit (family B)